MPNVSSSRLSYSAAALFLLVVAILIAPIGALVTNVIAQTMGGNQPPRLLVAADPLSDSVAATQADFQVDSTGAATYSVPLYVVPGTSGMAPRLSLEYSSRSGYGPVGKGWSIGGLSSITRCRATREAGDFNVGGTPTDGNPAPINYTATDRYCLDGQRLIPAQAGSGECAVAGGSSGQSLRTEIESFQRVCAYSAAGGTSGVSFFTVERKNGTISWYGDRDNNSSANRPDGYFNSTRPGYEGYALSWAQTRTQDSSGNYIDYVYLENPDGAAGEQLISEVLYSGKTVLAGQSGSASAPYARVSFSYSLRAAGQQSKNYAYGGMLSQAHRLEGITTCKPVEVVHAPLVTRRGFMV